MTKVFLSELHKFTPSSIHTIERCHCQPKRSTIQ